MKLGSDSQSLILDRVFKNRPSKICWRQPLKNFNWSILEYIVSYVHTNLTYLTWAFVSLQGYYLLSLGGLALPMVSDDLGFSLLKRRKLLN